MTAARRDLELIAAVNRWWWPLTGAAVATAWVGVAIAGSARIPPTAAAVAAGTAALAAAPALPGGSPGLRGIVALLVLPVAAAEAARPGNAAALSAVLGVVAFLTVYDGWRSRGPSLQVVAFALGVAAVVVGLTAGSLEADRLGLVVADRPSAAVVLAGAALVLTALDHRAGAERAALAPVLFAALLAAPALPPLAVVLGWGTLAVAGARLYRPAVGLAGLAVLAVAAGAAGAGILLGAGSVLAASLDSRLAALCGLPGAVVLAGALAGRPGTAVVLAAGAASVATALALAAGLRSGLRVDGGRAIALALGAWLVVAPGTWGFAAAAAELDPYDAGATRALATAALVAVLVLLRRGGELHWPGAEEDTGDEGDAWMVARPTLAGAVGALATVGSVAWLVVSVVRLH